MIREDACFYGLCHCTETENSLKKIIVACTKHFLTSFGHYSLNKNIATTYICYVVLDITSNIEMI